MAQSSTESSCFEEDSIATPLASAAVESRARRKARMGTLQQRYGDNDASSRQSRTSTPCWCIGLPMRGSRGRNLARWTLRTMSRFRAIREARPGKARSTRWRRASARLPGKGGGKTPGLRRKMAFRISRDRRRGEFRKQPTVGLGNSWVSETFLIGDLTTPSKTHLSPLSGAARSVLPSGVQTSFSVRSDHPGLPCASLGYEHAR